jgi:hypothetical protein
MACGAPVVAADNSSQPEVVGPAGRLIGPDDPGTWARVIAELLRDPARRAEMRTASLRQAATFSWQDTARRLLNGIGAGPGRSRLARPGRFALVLYSSPREPGYDAGAGRLAEALAARDGSVIFLETDRAVTLPPLPLCKGWYETHLLNRVRPVLGDPPVIHVVDRLEAAGPLIEALQSHPGLVVFASRDGTAASDHELCRVLGLARGVACRSERLRDRLAGLDPSAQVRMLPPTDDSRAAEALVNLVRAVETPRCPA